MGLFKNRLTRILLLWEFFLFSISLPYHPFPSCFPHCFSAYWKRSEAILSSVPRNKCLWRGCKTVKFEYQRVIFWGIVGLEIELYNEKSPLNLTSKYFRLEKSKSFHWEKKSPPTKGVFSLLCCLDNIFGLGFFLSFDTYSTDTKWINSPRGLSKCRKL